MDLLEIADSLAEDLQRLQFGPPAAYVYNPLIYARRPGADYLTRYGNGARETVFVGMNPGPWGMAQTGVPFGEIAVVRDWLGIEAEVDKPAREHPKKLVEGFACRRSEVSGRRLWGLFRERFASPARFFERFFVINYCPLLFLDGQGRNITPDKLKPAERERLLVCCDQALRRAMGCLKPKRVIGVGRFAAGQAATALAGMEIVTGQILHPSPANPQANRCWAETVLRQLREQGVDL